MSVAAGRTAGTSARSRAAGLTERPLRGGAPAPGRTSAASGTKKSAKGAPGGAVGAAGASPAKAQSRSRAGAVRSRAGERGGEAPVRAAVPVIGGVIWGVALIAAAWKASVAVAALLIPVAVVATASGLRAAGPPTRRPAASQAAARAASRRGAAGGRSRRAVTVGALVTSVALPLAALAGPLAALGAGAGLGLATLVLVLRSAQLSVRPLRTAAALGVTALTPAIAAASVIASRHQGHQETVALVAGALAFDLSAFLMGNARTALGGPFGLLAGIFAVAVVAIFVAAVMNPPYSGNRPWIVYGVLAVAAPAGVKLCDLASRGVRLPALRRLDSLVLAAPAWIVAVAVVAHR